MPKASCQTNGQATTVLLANGHRLFRLGLKEILSANESIEVLGEAENDEEAVTLTDETKPDIVVLDAQSDPRLGREQVRAHSLGRSYLFGFRVSKQLRFTAPPGKRPSEMICMWSLRFCRPHR
jgi:DNA-binding NarL/FixJ family response regulator